MMILCPIKRVIDYQVKIRVKSDGTGVETDNIPMTINPFDEIALEEAVRCKEQGLAKEVVALTIGTQECTDILRKALAHGADKAVLIEKNSPSQPMEIARCLVKYIERSKPDCVLMGKQAIDDDCNQTGQYLAGLLGWPQGTFASKIEFSGKTVKVTREVDSGLEILQLTLPAVITTDLRLNQPRYLSLPNIVKAKQKPLEIISYDEFSEPVQSPIKIINITTPAKRQKGVKVDSVAQLLQYLHEKEALRL